MVIIEVTFNIYPFPFYKIVKTLRTYTHAFNELLVLYYYFSVMSNWRVHQWLTNNEQQQHKKKKSFDRADETISVLICFNFFWWSPFATWNQTEHVQSKSKLTKTYCFIGTESQSANTVIRTRHEKRKKSTGTTKGRLVLPDTGCLCSLMWKSLSVSQNVPKLLRTLKCICLVFLTHTRARFLKDIHLCFVFSTPLFVLFFIIGLHLTTKKR